MPDVKSLDDLKRLKEEAIEKREMQANRKQAQITVGMGTCGIAVGARETMNAILDIVESKGLSDIIVAQTGCIGLCAWEPIVEVAIGQEPKVTYGRINPGKAREIVNKHIIDAKIITEYVIPV